MRLFPLFLIFICASASSETLLWLDNEQPISTKVVSNGRHLLLDQSSLEIILADTLDGNSVVAKRTVNTSDQSSKGSTRVLMPLPDGSEVSVNIEQTQVLSPELATKFPNIKTYRLSGYDRPDLTGNMNISQQGIFVFLRTETGKQIFIEPDANEIEGSYTSTWGGNKKNENDLATEHETHTCQLDDHDTANQPDYKNENIQARRSSAINNNMITYRLAVSVTRSYMAANGGTKSSALRAIASTINRINQVYQRDVGIRFVLVGNNDQLIAPSPSFSGSIDNMLRQNQSLVDRVIGNPNYDIGHLFTARGGGVAYVKSACRKGLKAMGVSGNLSVGKERFSLEFVAHEIGHQLGATHTFNGKQGLCTANNRSASTAYEPGSGSTIMSYIGICGSDNLQYHADAMFHIGSIQQILNHKRNYYAKSCGILSPSSNTAPTVNAGADYIIPANTPFELKGAAQDSDNNSLLYNWQQQDAGTASKINVDTGNNALFRSYLPTKAKHRSFPSMGALNGTRTMKGETLPKTNRLMHFQFIAQDSVGSTVTDSMTVRVVADGGAFRLNPLPATYTRGKDITVTWQVADTHLPPVSCSSVNIALSVNKGLHFNYNLATDVDNSGSAIVTLPNISFDKEAVRLKLSCSDNIFFSVSSKALENATNIARLNGSSSASGIAAIKNQSMGAGGGFSVFWLYLLSLGIVFRKNWRQ